MSTHLSRLGDIVTCQVCDINLIAVWRHQLDLVLHVVFAIP